MIAHLNGEVIFAGERFVVINAGGVGYKVYIAPTVLSTLRIGSDASIWTHLSVRENALDLYGFTEYADLNFFEMLIQISGIGPKGALGVMSVADTDTLKNAISSGDTSYLTKVSGIGKKSAEKIVLELRDKLSGGVETTLNPLLQAESEAMEALQSLGYTMQESRDVLAKIESKTNEPEQLVKEALKILGRSQ